MIDSREILDRAKIALNATSDMQLADMLGISKSTLSNWRARNSLDYTILFSKCEHINYNWLITGEGEMRNSSKPISIDHQFNLRTDRNIDAQDIPLYDFDATAGLVAIFNSHNIEPEDYLHIPNLPPVDGAIYVRGESMSPLLKSGDIVMYKKKELSMDSIFWGEIYLLSFIYDGDSYTAVKYIQKSNEPDKIRLVSFNPSFAPKDIPMNCVTALALVKASLTFHTME